MVVGDRAFTNCTPHYPNGNKQTTPHFLVDGRLSVAELASDDPLTTLRYSSEVYNRRVRDVTMLRDRVPRGKLQHISGVTNYAQGRAN